MAQSVCVMVSAVDRERLEAIAADKAAQLMALTCTEPPHQATHWTGRDQIGRRGKCYVGLAA